MYKVGDVVIIRDLDNIKSNIGKITCKRNETRYDVEWYINACDWISNDVNFDKKYFESSKINVKLLDILYK